MATAGPARLCCLAAAAAAMAAPSSGGLTLSVYNNTAAAGRPESKTVVAAAGGFDVWVPRSTASSVELTGTVTVDRPVNLSFVCRFKRGPRRSLLAFVWIGDHMAAYTPHLQAYLPTRTYSGGPLDMDGWESYPLRVARPNASLTVRTLLYTATETHARGPAPPGFYAIAGSTVGCTAGVVGCNLAQFRANSTTACGAACNATANCVAFELQRGMCTLRALAGPVLGGGSGAGVHFKFAAANDGLGVTVAWAELPTTDADDDHGSVPPRNPRQVASHTYNIIPSATLFPALPGPEEQRRELQRDLVEYGGWGPWLEVDRQNLVLLPQSAALRIELCQVSTKLCPLKLAGERVGYHAVDRSYVQMYMWYDGGINVSVAYSGGNGTSLVGFIEAISCPAACDDYRIRLSAGFAWGRSGNVSVTEDGGILFAPHNLPGCLLQTNGGRPANSTQPAVFVDFKPGDSGLQSNLSATRESAAFFSTVPEISTLASAYRWISNALATELARYDRFGPLSETKAAVQAGYMWNYVYVPCEAGPILPISREAAVSWHFTHSPISNDWQYVIFDWDDIFASYIAGLDTIGGKEIAYSNVIQTLKAKTSQGFVANWRAGGLATPGRSEPPIAGKMLLDLYRKFQDNWLIELLFDDVLGWHEWFWRRRRLPPANLICLGDDGDLIADGSDMQGGRWESGLDNSPMYDGDFFDPVTRQMQLYDTGMSSMLAFDADCLAELGDLIGRSDDAAELRSRSNELKRGIKTELWNESLGIFANKRPNGSFYARLSPTSFYPMLAKIPEDQQVTTMSREWLLRRDRFCLSTTWPEGVSDDCYWGLPSINAADPAYAKLGYWRGYVWGQVIATMLQHAGASRTDIGTLLLLWPHMHTHLTNHGSPMAQLVYWGLQNYNHLSDARNSRLALVTQMKELFLSQWRAHRHVCENYNPHKDAADCSGLKLYHWGGLAGLLSLQEAGMY